MQALSQNLTRNLSAPAAPVALPGCWKLAAGRAITLGAAQPGVVQIAHGRVWATLDGPHLMGGGRDAGDLFLEAGDRIALRAGQRVVLEPYGRPGDGAAYFSWQPDLTPVGSRWTVRVAQPAADLRLAVASVVFASMGVAAALGRLFLGLARLGVDVAAGRRGTVGA